MFNHWILFWSAPSVWRIRFQVSVLVDFDQSVTIRRLRRPKDNTICHLKLFLGQESSKTNATCWESLAILQCQMGFFVYPVPFSRPWVNSTAWVEWAGKRKVWEGKKWSLKKKKICHSERVSFSIFDTDQKFYWDNLLE